MGVRSRRDNQTRARNCINHVSTWYVMPRLPHSPKGLPIHQEPELTMFHSVIVIKILSLEPKMSERYE